MVSPRPDDSASRETPAKLFLYNLRVNRNNYIFQFCDALYLQVSISVIHICFIVCLLFSREMLNSVPNFSYMYIENHESTTELQQLQQNSFKRCKYYMCRVYQPA